MRDYITQAQNAVLRYEEEDEKGTKTKALLAPWDAESLIELQLETDQLIFVGKLYNAVRCLEAAAHRFQNRPKDISEHIIGFFLKILRGGKRPIEEEAIEQVTTLAEQMWLLMPAINAMEEMIENSDIRDLRLDGLTVTENLERRYLELLERAEFSKECLLEKLTWAKRVLNESLPAWGYR